MTTAQLDHLLDLLETFTANNILVWQVQDHIQYHLGYETMVHNPLGRDYRVSLLISQDHAPLLLLDGVAIDAYTKQAANLNLAKLVTLVQNQTATITPVDLLYEGLLLMQRYDKE